MKLKLYVAGMLLLLQALVFGKSIDVAAGPFTYFGIELPRGMIAGETYIVTLTAYDAYGNKTDYFGEGERIFTFETTGDAAVTPAQLNSGMFASGSVTVKLSDRLTEVATLGVTEGGRPLLVKDAGTGEFVSSFNLNVGHASLASFALTAPKAPVAGEPFEITVTAKDTQENVIADYGNFGRGVTVVVEGQKGKRSFTIPAHSFENGKASVALRYDMPESVRIRVTEVDGEAEGTAGPFKLAPQVLSRVEIKQPSSIRAGVLFPLELTAYNQFGRVMKNYAVVGSDLMLSTTGTGRLIPDRVPASAFIEGTATFETLYTKPEAIEINVVPVEGVKPKIERSSGEDQTGAEHSGVTPAPKSERIASTKSSPEAPTPKKAASEPVRITPMPDVEVHSSGLKETAPAKPKGKALRLSLRFAQSLGNIERIDSEFKPDGDLGVTLITVQFANAVRAEDISAVKKEIRVKGRHIGTLSMTAGKNEKGVVIRIDEREPFSVEAKGDGSTLNLSFFLFS